MNYHKGRGAQIDSQNRFRENHIARIYPEGLDEDIQHNVHTQIYIEILAIIKAASEHGAVSAGYTVVVRLKGAVKEILHNWLHKNLPERADKVWSQIAGLNGGHVNDTQWGRRMVRSGVIIQSIAQLFS
jgi:hypothetical protein